MSPPNLEHLLRELAPQVLGAILRRYRDFAAAEDAVQEAFLAAATQWPREGLPENPRAWLTHVASRRMTDQIRADVARRRREAVAAMETGYAIPAPDPEGHSDEDDTLVLVYMCCHQALTTSSAIALTLRAVGGLTTAEIAHAFLVPEATMAQRISRARQTIKDSDVPFRMPVRDEQPQRRRAVLQVLYLIFNEGYTASEGEHLQRPDLAIEAIRLTRLVHAKLPGDTETAGLLALMLLTHARRAARSGPRNEVIPLDQQDRSLWDRTLIAEGVELISAALARGSVGPYQLQAAIAAVHDEAATASDTDWPQILALYTVLKRIVDNPIVALNHAVAVAMVHGPREGLRLIAELDATGRLRDHHRLHAVRAHLLEMANESAAAIENYQAAAARTASLPERNYLLAQAARLRGSQP
jgi:RNA polymerase sigma factor (sigma-70 family)